MKAKISDQEFFDFYRGASPDLPDAPDATEEEPAPSRPIAKPPSPWPRITGIGVLILVFLGGLSVLGYLIFSSPQTLSSLDMSLDGPREVSSGNEVIYTLRVKNQSPSDLSGLTLTARYPAGFEYTYASREPVNERKNFWNLDGLAKGETLVLTMRGALYGVLDEEKIISTSVTYQQKGISAEFSQEASFTSRITTAGLSHRLVAPASVQPGEAFPISISYDAFDALPQADDVALTLVFPSGMTVISSTPAFQITPPGSPNERVWPASVLKKRIDESNKTGELVLLARFDAAQKEAITVTSRFSLKNRKENEQTAIIAVAAGTLTGTLRVNGSVAPAPVNFGNPIPLDLVIANGSSESLSNMVISLSLDSPLIQWTTLKDRTGGLLSEHTLTWSSREFPALTELLPGKKVSLPLSIALKNIADFRTLPDEVKSLDPFFFIASLSASASGAESKQEFKLLPITIKNPVNSDLYVSSVVSEKTNVAWTITNSLHDLDAVEMKGLLGEGLGWSGDGRVEAGEIAFDETTRMITWSINRIPRTVPALSASFSFTGAGDSKKALSKIVVTAKDRSTGDTISIPVASGE